MNAFLLPIIAVAPGYLAAWLARAWLAMGHSLFTFMSPERVPHAVAIYVTQWWLTLIGVGLLACVADNLMRERTI